MSTSRRRRIILIGISVVVLLLLASPFVCNGVLDYLIYHHRFSSEMRVISSDGTIEFRAYNLHLEDKGHMVNAAFRSLGLWPTHHVSTDHHDYLFGPLGRVAVLSKAGIHARVVTDIRWWTGDPHSFPFSDSPMTKEMFDRYYGHNTLSEAQ